MKLTVDTGGLIYEFVEPEGWGGELEDWDRKLLRMTLQHVLFTLGPAQRGDMLPPPRPPKGRLT